MTQTSAQQYQADFVHRYADSTGATTWDVVGLAQVSQGRDGLDMRNPGDAVYFISLSADGKAHVFFHGKDKNGARWLTATETFIVDPTHAEEIVLEDQSKLYVMLKPVQ